MPWPPTIPPTTRANATLQLDAHPSDHNALAQALTDIVTRLGTKASPAQVIRQGTNANTAAAVAGTTDRSDWLKMNGWVYGRVRWSATAAGTATTLWVVYPAGYEPLTVAQDAVCGYAAVWGGAWAQGYANQSSAAANSQGFTVLPAGTQGFYATALAAGHIITFTVSYPALTP